MNDYWRGFVNGCTVGISVAVIAFMLAVTGYAGERNYTDCKVLDTGEPTCPYHPYEDFEAMQQTCEITYPPILPGDVGYGKWRTREVYYIVLHHEMCLAWYALQQPKNHWLVLSRGAQNF